jgi:hypothetical protein
VAQACSDQGLDLVYDLVHASGKDRIAKKLRGSDNTSTI